MASLLLSLLLLLSVLVYAMTQVGAIVERYAQEIMRGVMRDELVRRQAAEQISPKSAPSPSVTRAPAAPAKATGVVVSQMADRPAGPVHLRLVFESGVSDLQPIQAAQISAAVRQLKLPPETLIRLITTAPESDEQYQRSAYRLQLQVRRILVDQGHPQEKIGLQVRRSANAPPGYEQGEVPIYLTHAPAPAAPESAR